MPTDFSETSRLALGYALFLAERWDASIEVLHVWQLPAYVSPDLTLWRAGARERPLHEVAAAESGARMDEFLRPLDDAQRRRVTVHVRSGEPVDVILEQAASSAAELIVMGTQGRSAFSQLFMGSVAERVVRRAACPVLTVRAHPEDDAREG